MSSFEINLCILKTIIQIPKANIACLLSGYLLITHEKLISTFNIIHHQKTT